MTNHHYKAIKILKHRYFLLLNFELWISQITTTRETNTDAHLMLSDRQISLRNRAGSLLANWPHSACTKGTDKRPRWCSVALGLLAGVGDVLTQRGALPQVPWATVHSDDLRSLVPGVQQLEGGQV